MKFRARVMGERPRFYDSKKGVRVDQVRLSLSDADPDAAGRLDHFVFVDVLAEEFKTLSAPSGTLDGRLVTVTVGTIRQAPVGGIEFRGKVEVVKGS